MNNEHVRASLSLLVILGSSNCPVLKTFVGAPYAHCMSPHPDPTSQKSDLVTKEFNGSKHINKDWKLMFFLQIWGEVDFLHCCSPRKLVEWEKLMMHRIHRFPIQVWPQVHINDSTDETSRVVAKSDEVFWSAHCWQNVKANQLWSAKELRHVAVGVGGAGIFSCTMLHTRTIMLHIYSYSSRWKHNVFNTYTQIVR